MSELTVSDASLTAVAADVEASARSIPFDSALMKPSAELFQRSQVSSSLQSVNSGQATRATVVNADVTSASQSLLAAAARYSDIDFQIAARAAAHVR